MITNAPPGPFPYTNRRLRFFPVLPQNAPLPIVLDAHRVTANAWILNAPYPAQDIAAPREVCRVNIAYARNVACGEVGSVAWRAPGRRDCLPWALGAVSSTRGAITLLEHVSRRAKDTL